MARMWGSTDVRTASEILDAVLKDYEERANVLMMEERYLQTTLGHIQTEIKWLKSQRGSIEEAWINSEDVDVD